MDNSANGGIRGFSSRGSGNVYPTSFKDYEDGFEREEIPAIRDDAQDLANMSVPERIVLSAGYDGDDNTNDVRRVTSDIFSEQAIPAPDTVMMGMRAPPSTLTVDDSSSVYSRPAARGMRHSDGDGSDRVQSPYRIRNAREMLRQEDDRWWTKRDIPPPEEDVIPSKIRYYFAPVVAMKECIRFEFKDVIAPEITLGRSSDEELTSDRVVAVGNESVHLPMSNYRGDVVARLQRRISYVERALDYYRWTAQMWNYALLALTIINPIVLVYYFRRSK